MAIGTENYPNTAATTADYPYGGIKDNTGAGNGTPINKLTNDDIHQNLRKILALAGIAPNNLPDNVTNGFQYISGLDKLYKRFIGVRTIGATTNLTVADIGKLINVFGTSGFIDCNIPSGANLRDGDNLVIYNNGNFPIIITSLGSEFINGGSDLTLVQQGDFVELVLDKANFDWKIANMQITPLPYVATIITVGSGGGAPAFQNSWGASNGTLRFRLLQTGQVVIEGQVSKASNGSGVIFTLPLGWRPPQNRYFPILITQGGSNVTELLYIQTTGTVSLNNPAAATTDAYLTGINFFV